jgi:hypothetical protein
MKHSYLAIVFLCLTSAVMAQHRHFVQSQRSKDPYLAKADSITKSFVDSLKAMNDHIDDNSFSVEMSADNDALKNPYFYRLFVSPLLYKDAIGQVMQIPTPEEPTAASGVIDQNLTISNHLNDFFVSLYNKYPYWVHSTDEVLDKTGRIRSDINTRVDHKIQVSDVVKIKELDRVIEPIEAVSHKPNFWSFKQTFSLQLMQNYSNDKWYKGGNNYNSMLARYRLYANYNNKEKITFNNTLEMNLGFQTNKEDTEHKFKTNEDLLRLTNNLGVQATGRWYYSVQLQSWTQFLPKYNSNSNYVYSDFMSPFESVLSVGMDYKYNKSNFNFTLHLAPLAYDFKYVDRDDLTSRYGVKGNHHSYETIGSNITATWTVKLLKELSWNSRMYYFTNYEKIQVEWENTFTFTINKYLSSQFYVYPRFDDSYVTDKSNAVIQFKEWLSLGLNLTF